MFILRDKYLKYEKQSLSYHKYVKYENQSLSDHKYVKYEKQSLSLHYKKIFLLNFKVLPFSEHLDWHVHHPQEQIWIISVFICFVSLGKNLLA